MWVDRDMSWEVSASADSNTRCTKEAAADKSIQCNGDP